MRHGKKNNHLGRTAPHRKAMLSNMACSLIEHKRINTTVAKAKALRVYVEPILTRAKEDTTHNRRTVFAYLQNKYAVTELFRTVAPKIADRPGGYTRIIKTGFRVGDAADTAMIELVDFNDLYNPKAEEKKATRRSRRSTAKKAAVSENVSAEESSTVTETDMENVTMEESTEATTVQASEEQTSEDEMTEGESVRISDDPNAPADEQDVNTDKATGTPAAEEEEK